jgi:hypothetical protein
VVHQFFAIAAHHEQRIVDRQPQTHGRYQVQGEHRDLGETADHVQRKERRHHRQGSDSQGNGGRHHPSEDEQKEQQRQRNRDHLGPQQVVLDRRVHRREQGPHASGGHRHRRIGVVSPVLLGDATGELDHQVVVVGITGQDQGPVTLRGPERISSRQVPVGQDVVDGQTGVGFAGQLRRQIAPRRFDLGASTSPSRAVTRRITLGVPVPNSSPTSTSARVDSESGSSKPPELRRSATPPPDQPREHEDHQGSEEDHPAVADGEVGDPCQQHWKLTQPCEPLPVYVQLSHHRNLRLGGERTSEPTHEHGIAEPRRSLGLITLAATTIGPIRSGP